MDTSSRMPFMLVSYGEEPATVANHGWAPAPVGFRSVRSVVRRRVRLPPVDRDLGGWDYDAPRASPAIRSSPYRRFRASPPPTRAKDHGPPRAACDASSVERASRRRIPSSEAPRRSPGSRGSPARCGLPGIDPALVVPYAGHHLTDDLRRPIPSEAREETCADGLLLGRPQETGHRPLERPRLDRRPAHLAVGRRVTETGEGTFLEIGSNRAGFTAIAIDV